MKNNGQSGGTAGIDIGLLGAWEFTTGSDQVTVAVIGAAADDDHPDFAPAIGEIRINPEGDAGQRGTSIAGIIAAEANNGEGMAGVDQECAVLTYETYNSVKIQAAVNAGADVIALVLTEEDPDDADGRAVAYAYNHDALLLAHTGNDSGQIWYYPAGFDGVLGVGGIRDVPFRPRQTTIGPTVDLVAPAADTLEGLSHYVTSLDYPVGYRKVWETEYACAHVTGAASLLRGAHPELSNDDVANVLQLSAHDFGPAGWDVAFGHGLLKIDSAFRILEKPNVLRQWAGTPSEYFTSDTTQFIFKTPDGLATGIYEGVRHELRRNVTFQKQYFNAPSVWARGSVSLGYKDTVFHWGTHYSGIVGGSVTQTGMELVTHVYELWDTGGTSVGWWPCSPAQAIVSYGILGEELLVSPPSQAGFVTQGRIHSWWTDTLDNEATWHVDRKVNGVWQNDYGVLPAGQGVTTFVDSNAILGSTEYRYRVHPTNVHQSPAIANEAWERTPPNPPACKSAYVLYVNIYDPEFDPSSCSQNESACEGCDGGIIIEQEMGFGGGEFEQQSEGSGGCRASSAIVVEWEPPVNQASGTLSSYTLNLNYDGNDHFFTYPTSQLCDTFCIARNKAVNITVQSKDIYNQHSLAGNSVNLYTGNVWWCGGGNETKLAVPDGHAYETAARSFSLTGNSPNPFNAGTVFSFTLAEAEHWDLSVVDILGRTVRRFSGDADAGPVSVSFDGRDESGHDLASGVYFWRVTTPTATGVRKMAIVK